MSNRVLLAVDESKNSMRAVRYVAQSIKPDSEVTLLSILPDAAGACDLDSRSLTPLFNENRAVFCSLEDTKKDRLQDFMRQARDVLVKAGFESKKVTTRVRKKKSGIARDIMKEAARGNFDTLVVGRRGISGVKEFLFGSISTKLLDLASGKAVIVVP